MAVSYTVDRAGSGVGPYRFAAGTFTSAAGDGNGETLTASTHGLNYILFSDITLNTGGLNAPQPKVTISNGTITWTVQDTLGYSGKWYVLGR